MSLVLLVQGHVSAAKMTAVVAMLVPDDCESGLGVGNTVRVGSLVAMEEAPNWTLSKRGSQYGMKALW